MSINFSTRTAVPSAVRGHYNHYALYNACAQVRVCYVQSEGLRTRCTYRPSRVRLRARATECINRLRVVFDRAALRNVYTIPIHCPITYMNNTRHCSDDVLTLHVEARRVNRYFIQTPREIALSHLCVS